MKKVSGNLVTKLEKPKVSGNLLQVHPSLLDILKPPVRS